MQEMSSQLRKALQKKVDRWIYLNEVKIRVSKRPKPTLAQQPMCVPRGNYKSRIAPTNKRLR